MEERIESEDMLIANIVLSMNVAIKGRRQMGSNWRETWDPESIIKICKALWFLSCFCVFCSFNLLPQLKK